MFRGLFIIIQKFWIPRLRVLFISIQQLGIRCSGVLFVLIQQLRIWRWRVLFIFIEHLGNSVHWFCLCRYSTWELKFKRFHLCWYCILGLGVRDSVHIDTAAGNSGPWLSLQMFYPLPTSPICAIPIFSLVFSPRKQLMFLHPPTSLSKHISAVSILFVCSSSKVGHSSPHNNVCSVLLHC